MVRNSGYYAVPFSSPYPSRISFPFRFLVFVLVLLIFPSCSDKKNKDNSVPSPTSGFTLTVSGGTLNNGTTEKGLVVLATLRNSAGSGPGGAADWQITITGPGISSPLIVAYDDGSPSSYITWRWDNIEPQSGTYTATASNGTFSLVRTFTIDSTKTLSTTTLSKSGDTISWPSVTDAGSYYYQIKDGYGTVADSGYLSSSLTSFVTPTLPDGDYQVEVYAHTRNRIALMTDPSSDPTLPAQENMSVSKLTLPISGTGSGYYLKAAGGVLYMGKDFDGVDQYSLAVWSSIQTSTGGTPPSGNWNMSVTGPGISGSFSFTYPAAYSHYLDWDFWSVPSAGLYDVSATNGVITLTDSFTIPNTTSQFPVATNLAVNSSAGGYTISWNAVPGASSYYVNLWTCVGAGSQNTEYGCTNGGQYTETAGRWVNTTSAFVQDTTLTSGLVYDVYVTASAVDMTTNTTPPAPGAQTDMSDTTFTYVAFTAQ
jgi:hypothetical protein